MSILIKGMEMPTSCISCLLNFGEKRPEYGLTIYCPYSDGVISWRDKAFDNGRLASCGIVSAPPHGRLIEEADAIKTVWMILNGLGYLKEENPQLEQTVREVFATAPAIERKNMDKRRTANLDGKCGSCRYFTAEQGRECCGFCSGRMKRKGRIMRTYKCIGYEAAPTIIPAEEET